MRRKPPSPRTLIFLAALGLTVFVWVLRGFAILSFVPGGILLLLILFTVFTGVLSTIEGIR